MATRFIKEGVPIGNNQNFLNDGLGDSVIGGLISAVPTGVVASQGNALYPGDRIILGAAEALALSDTAVGTLYAGLYMYVRTLSTAVIQPALGKAAFWDLTVADSQYQVTSDETATLLFAGVFINTLLTRGNAWWICIAGKVLAKFKAVLTNPAAAIGNAAYLAADTTATFDCRGGMGNPTFTQMDAALNQYAGVCETAPVGGASSLIDMPMRMYRW
jgi:hypothetical protein